MPRFKSHKVFGWASFFNDLGSDMVFSVWPAFVTQTLGASVSFLGFLDGFGDALVALSQMVSGIVSDRLGRRKIFVWVGYIGGIFGRIGYALARTPGALIVPRILDRSGKIRETPRDALVAEAVSEAERGRAYGFIRALDNSGAVVGILIAFVLLQFAHIPMRWLFVIAAVPSVASVLLVLLFIKEPERPVVKTVRPPLSFKPVLNSRALRLVLLAVVFFGFANFSYSFLLLAAKRVGVPIAFLPVLYLTFTVVAALSSAPFGKLIDRVGPRNVLILGLELFAAAMLATSVISYIFVTPLLFVVYGLYKGAMEPSQRALIASLAEPSLRATTLGTMQFVLGIAAIPASLAAGILWDVTGGPFVPFLISGTLAIFASVPLFFLKPSKIIAQG